MEEDYKYIHDYYHITKVVWKKSSSSFLKGYSPIEEARKRSVEWLPDFIEEYGSYPMLFCLLVDVR